MIDAAPPRPEERKQGGASPRRTGPALHSCPVRIIVPALSRHGTTCTKTLFFSFDSLTSLLASTRKTSRVPGVLSSVGAALTVTVALLPWARAGTGTVFVPTFLPLWKTTRVRWFFLASAWPWFLT